MSIVLLHYFPCVVVSLEVKQDHWSYTPPLFEKCYFFKKSSDVRKNYCLFYFLRGDKFPWSSQCLGWWWTVTLLVIQWREIKFTMGCFLQLTVHHYRFWQFARQYCQSCWREPQSSVLQAWQQWTLESDSSTRKWTVVRAPHICWNQLCFLFSAPLSLLIALTLLSLSYKSLVLV